MQHVVNGLGSAVRRPTQMPPRTNNILRTLQKNCKGVKRRYSPKKISPEHKDTTLTTPYSTGRAMVVSYRSNTTLSHHTVATPVNGHKSAHRLKAQCQQSPSPAPQTANI